MLMEKVHFEVLCLVSVITLIVNRNLYNCNYTPHYKRASTEYWAESQRNKSPVLSTKPELLINLTSSHSELSIARLELSNQSSLELLLIVVGCQFVRLLRDNKSTSSSSSSSTTSNAHQ